MTVPTETPSARIPMPADGSSHKSYQPELSAALMDMQAAIMRHCSLDPVTIELVRIRCAHVHDCRVCSHVRLQPARDAGLVHVDRRDVAQGVDPVEPDDPQFRGDLQVTARGARGREIATQVIGHWGDP